MIQLGTSKVIKKTVLIPVTQNRFKYLINKYKPSELYCTPYSTKKPCYHIVEYLEGGKVLFYADSAADKTPKEITYDQLYKYIENSLSECYFNPESVKNKP